MDNRVFWLILLLAVIPAIGLFARPYLVNNDTFFYNNFSCGKHGLDNRSLIEEVIFRLMPCDALAYKFVGLLLLIDSSFLLSLIGMQLFQKRGEFAGLVAFLSPTWATVYLKLENDAFGYILMLVSLLFLVIYFKERARWQLGVSLLLLGLAGWVYNGAIFMVVALALVSVPHLWFLALVFGFQVTSIQGLFSNAFPLFGDLKFSGGLPFIGEHLPLIGAIELGALIFALHRLLPRFFWPTLFSFLLAVFSPQLTWFPVVFLSLSFPEIINSFEAKNPIKDFNLFMSFLLVIGLVVAVMLAYSFYSDNPNSLQMEGIEKAIALSESTGKPLLNDWWLGDFVIFAGGTPSSRVVAELPKNPNNAIVLTVNDLNCARQGTYGHFPLGDLKVFEC